MIRSLRQTLLVECLLTLLTTSSTILLLRVSALHADGLILIY